jgi:hypothetical protein
MIFVEGIDGNHPPLYERVDILSGGNQSHEKATNHLPAADFWYPYSGDACLFQKGASIRWRSPNISRTDD